MVVLQENYGWITTVMEFMMKISGLRMKLENTRLMHLVAGFLHIMKVLATFMKAASATVTIRGRFLRFQKIKLL